MRPWNLSWPPSGRALAWLVGGALACFVASPLLDNLRPGDDEVFFVGAMIAAVVSGFAGFWVWMGRTPRPRSSGVTRAAVQAAGLGAMACFCLFLVGLALLAVAL